MANEIKTMLNAVKGVKKDWKEDFKETSKSDWKFDFDAVPGNAPGAAPANMVLPVISGTAASGSVLTTTNGTWTGNPTPTFTYQWKRGLADIVGATSASYTLVDADASQSISVIVRGTNSIGTGAVTAAAVTVADLPPVGP